MGDAAIDVFKPKLTSFTRFEVRSLIGLPNKVRRLGSFGHPIIGAKTPAFPHTQAEDQIPLHSKKRKTTSPPTTAVSHLSRSSRQHGRRKEQEIVKGQEGVEEEDGSIRQKRLV